MKYLIFSLALFVSLAYVPKAEAQIPVTDATSIANSIAGHIDTLLKWKAQFDQMQARINQAKRSYEALTGARNLGDLYNNPIFRNYLPPEWQRVYDKTKQLGYGGAPSYAYQEYQARQQFDACAKLLIPEERTSCESLAIKSTIEKGFALQAFGLAFQRSGQITDLRKAINGTKDPKAIAELQARIAAEQAAIQNEQTKIDLYKLTAKAEQEILEQQQKEKDAKTLSSRGLIQPTPKPFGR